MELKYEWINDPDKKLPENYPEKLDERMSSRARIADSIKLFEDNFDETGRPITRYGQKLFKKYNYYYCYTSEKVHHYVINSVRKWFKDHAKHPRCFACFEIIDQGKVTMKLEDRPTLHFHSTCSEKAYKLVFKKSNRK